MAGAHIRLTEITNADGLALEALWSDPPDGGDAAAVFCHPHPLDGGTMRAPLMEEVADHLKGAGIHVLRFNFRGVGESEGSWSKGVGEVDDVDAAVAAAVSTHPDLPLGVVGWSFGATTSLRWQAEKGSTLPWVGIAPGIRSYRGAAVPDTTRLDPAPRLIIVGDRDQFADPADMQRFADGMDARLEVLRGSDHFFYFRYDRVAALVVTHLRAATDLNEG